MRWTVLALILPVMYGCAVFSDGMSAEDSLTLRAIAGEEEDLAQGFTEVDQQRLPLFRACNADGEYRDLFADFDSDGSGDLEIAEQREVFADSDDEYGRIRAQRWEMLTLIYDGDNSGALNDKERTNLFNDFTVRCEAIHQRLLGDYDLDGDGEILGDERDQLDADLRELHGERLDDMREHRADMREEHQGGDRPNYLMFAADYDSDADGELSDKELTVLRDAMRAKIRSGDPLHPDGVEDDAELIE